MKNIKIWIKAFRLRTLPLGTFKCHSWEASWHLLMVISVGMCLLLAILTTLFLQILSNLANDYGDAMHGTDNENRIGPQRITQSGLVTKKQMQAMIALLIVLALISGIFAHIYRSAVYRLENHSRILPAWDYQPYTLPLNIPSARILMAILALEIYSFLSISVLWELPALTIFM